MKHLMASHVGGCVEFAERMLRDAWNEKDVRDKLSQAFPNMEVSDSDLLFVKMGAAKGYHDAYHAITEPVSDQITKALQMNDLARVTVANLSNIMSSCRDDRAVHEFKKVLQPLTSLLHEREEEKMQLFAQQIELMTKVPVDLLTNELPLDSVPRERLLSLSREFNPTLLVMFTVLDGKMPDIETVKMETFLPEFMAKMLEMEAPPIPSDDMLCDFSKFIIRQAREALDSEDHRAQFMSMYQNFSDDSVSDILKKF